MLILLIAYSIASYFEPLPNCYGERCIRPFVFHNFTNCPPVLLKRRASNGMVPFYRKECPNEGTWGCANFTADWPHPMDGYVRSGETDYSFLDCCAHKNVRFAEAVLRVRHDLPPIRRSTEVTFTDWELKVHNVELRGQQGDVVLMDGKGAEETCHNCYDFDFFGGNLMHVGLSLNYTDAPNVTMWCPVDPPCSMVLGLYLDGALQHVSHALAMDKFVGIELGDLIIAIVRGMFEAPDVGEGNDELHLLALWDIIPDDAFVEQRARTWNRLGPADAYCVPQCPAPEPSAAVATPDVWWLFALLMVLGFCVLCGCCFVLFAIAMARRSTAPEWGGPAKVGRGATRALDEVGLIDPRNKRSGQE